METDHSLLGESRTSFHSHRECIEEEYKYANEFGKQGRKNPRNIPKFTINHHAIEKNIWNIRPRTILRDPNYISIRLLVISRYSDI